MNSRTYAKTKKAPSFSVLPARKPAARRRSLTPHVGETHAGFDFGSIPLFSDNENLIQTKLTIGKSGDKYEQEADSMADRVMSMPEPNVQRDCADCDDKDKVQRLEDDEEREEEMVSKQEVDEEKDEEEVEDMAQPKELRRQPVEEEEEEIATMSNELRRETDEDEEEEIANLKSLSGGTPQVTTELQNSISSMKGGGQPLPDSTRAFFEPRFKRDFSNVRLHTGREFSKAAVALNAKAFTVGSDIVFGPEQYAPDTQGGKHLLAHELTHVVQQGYTTPTYQRQAEGTSKDVTNQASTTPTSGNINSVVDEADKGTRKAIDVLEKALKAADEALAAKIFPQDKLARILIQANKLRPMLEAYRKVERGEQPDTNLTLDFNPKRDEIDEGDADLLAQSELEDSELVSTASPQLYASRNEHGRVSLRVGTVNVQRFVCGGLCIGAAIALGGLLLSGCSGKAKIEKKKVTIQPVAVANDDGKNPTTIPSFAIAKTIWGKCCIDLTINASKQVNKTAYKELDTPLTCSPQREALALANAAAISGNVISVFVPDTLKDGGKTGKNVHGGGFATDANTINPKAFLVSGTHGTVVAHELGHAMGHASCLGRSGHLPAGTVMVPTGAYNSPALEKVASVICTNVRGFSGAAGSGNKNCAEDLT